MINPSSDPVEPQEQSHRQQLGVFGAHLLKKDLKKRSEALGGVPPSPLPVLTWLRELVLRDPFGCFLSRLPCHP